MRYTRDIIDPEAVKALVADGKTYQEIAELFDVSPKLISDFMIRNGFRKRKENPNKGKMNQIKHLRKDRGIKRKELAQAVGVSVESVRKHEQNIKQPSEENAIKYAEALDVKSIFYGEG